MGKKIVSVLTAGIIFLMLSCATGQVNRTVATGAREPVINKIVGTWAFENPDYDGMTLMFGEDNTITMGNDTFKTIGTYQVDFKSEPILLDIQWPELGIVKTIIRFIDDNKIQIENSDLESERPEFFTENSELLVRVE